MIQKRTQLSVFALAALAMAALVAVLLLASPGGGAQAQTIPTPEGCGDIVPVEDGGSVALFEAYWHPQRKNLEINRCPPHIQHTTETEWYQDAGGKWLTREVGVTHRSQSDVNIHETILHVPTRAMHTLTADDDDTWDVDDYGFLGEAGDKVWILPGENTDLLHIGFSGGLLHEGQWVDDVIEYQFESVREPGVGPDDRGVIIVFTDSGDDPTGRPRVEWSTNVAANDKKIAVSPGKYVHRNWAFTKPGTYVLQVQALGQPVRGPGGLLPKTARVESVTSRAVEYTFHVGLLADLAVTVSDDDAEPAIGEQVTLTVTASNAGPDAAPHAKVQVSLPEGLTYVSSSADDDTSYDADEGLLLWDVGALDAPASRDAPTTATLTITATVDDGTRGMELTTTARIWATTSIGESQIIELDTSEDNNQGMDSLTPQVRVNAAPLFRVTRSVTENASGGTLLGDPVTAYDPDGDMLTYTLAGPGAELFDVDSAGQVSVKQGAVVNYEDAASYDLVLEVSDGKDHEGNDDKPDTKVVDHTIGLHITVQDVADETLVVALAADATTQPVNGYVHFTATVTNSPVPSDQLRYRWEGENTTGNGGTSASTFNDPTWRESQSAAGTWEYDVAVWYLENGEPTGEFTSNTVTVVWE